jgi:hypothetical protein
MLGCQDLDASYFEPAVAFIDGFGAANELREPAARVIKEPRYLLLKMLLIVLNGEDVRGLFFSNASTNFLSV